MAKTLVLTFRCDGTVEKLTQGFAGRSCATDTAWVERALGDVESREWTREAAKPERTATRQQATQ